MYFYNFRQRLYATLKYINISLYLFSIQFFTECLLLQILHHGSTVVIWEGVEGVAPPGGPRGILQYLRLDRSSTTLTWVRPSWSGLKIGYTNETDPFSTDFNLSFNPEETLSPGLLTKLALQASGEQSTGSTLDDG